MREVVGRVGVYARFSTEKQSEASIEDQIRRCHGWIVAHGGEPSTARPFTDFAISGASTDRPGFRELMRAIERAELDTVIVDDASRLSRDVEDSARAFKVFAFHDVRFVAVVDGVDTANRGAGTAFGFKSLMSAEFLSFVRESTMRGLEGRARGGLSTGGLPLGYRSIAVDPANPLAGRRIEIDPDRADTVRRIFGMYLAGGSFGSISAHLNESRTPTPRAHPRRAAEGWTASAVRAILKNARYSGAWSFGSLEWRKVPGTNRRLPRKRKGGPLVSEQRPELAIIDPATWEAVSARFEANPKRPTTQARRAYFLSGIARCGSCGAVLSANGGNATEGRRYYQCADARTRGGSICSNRSTLRIDTLEGVILSEISARLAACMAEVREIAAQEIEASGNAGARSHLDRQIAEAERQIGRLVDAIAEGSGSGSRALPAKLAELERRAEKLRGERAAMARVRPSLPSATEIAGRVASLSTLDTADPAAAREHLRAMLDGGRVDVHAVPNGEGLPSAWVARWTLLPGALLAAPETRTPSVSGGRSRCVSRSVDTEHCGDRI